MLSNTPEKVKQKFLYEFTLSLLEKYPDFKKNIIKKNKNQIHKSSVLIEPYQKIFDLLNQEQINAVECTGADKFLIMKKGSDISITNISLEEEEIQEVIKKIAEKYNTELDDNTLSVESNEFKISGIISKHAGSRFLIRKF
jgi:Flp pilus assembly CpaF family ATPase